MLPRSQAAVRNRVHRLHRRQRYVFPRHQKSQTNNDIDIITIRTVTLAYAAANVYQNQIVCQHSVSVTFKEIFSFEQITIAILRFHKFE